MANTTPSADAAPWQALETSAYHAYREWPVWLVLRERELARRVSADPSVHTKPEVSRDQADAG